MDGLPDERGKHSHAYLQEGDPAGAAGEAVTTPVIPERRKPLTRKQRVDQHDRLGGTCCVCLMPIPENEPFIDEHIIPLELGGSNDKSNRGIAHIPCAKIKTARDRKVIAKAVRQRAKHLGIRKTKTRPLPGGRNDPRKRTISGEVIDRRTGQAWRGR